MHSFSGADAWVASDRESGGGGAQRRKIVRNDIGSKLETSQFRRLWLARFGRSRRRNCHLEACTLLSPVVIVHPAIICGGKALLHVLPVRLGMDTLGQTFDLHRMKWVN